MSRVVDPPGPIIRPAAQPLDELFPDDNVLRNRLRKVGAILQGQRVTKLGRTEIDGLLTSPGFRDNAYAENNVRSLTIGNDYAYLGDGATGDDLYTIARYIVNDGRLRITGGYGAGAQLYLHSANYGSEGSDFYFTTSAGGSVMRYDHSQGYVRWYDWPLVDVQGIALAGTTAPTGDGIRFPATQGADTNANTLDDYEEGTWSPVVEGDGTAGSGTYATQAGRYLKIGRQVLYWGQVDYSSHDGTGNLIITGLPFAVDTVISAAALSVLGLTFSNAMVQAVANGSQLDFYDIASGGSSLLAIDAAADIAFSGVYMASG